MNDDGLVLELSDQPSETEAVILRDALIAENSAYLGERDHCPLALFLRARGRLVGGLLGETARGVLNINLFWLAAGQRRRGLGSRLLQAAETEASRRGCRMVWLETYDFQARPFYERHGYELFGELDGLPNGHRSYFLRKALGGSAGETTA